MYEYDSMYLKDIEAICEFMETTHNYLFFGNEGIDDMSGLFSI